MEYCSFSNYRFLLTSHTHFDGPTSAIGAVMFGVGFVTERAEPIIDIYSITEKDYKLADNYKIGLVGNPNYLTPNEQFYISDLRSMLQSSTEPLVGVLSDKAAPQPQPETPVDPVPEVPPVDGGAQEEPKP